MRRCRPWTCLRCHRFRAFEPRQVRRVGRPGGLGVLLHWGVDNHPWPERLLFQPPSWSGGNIPPRENTKRDIAREVMHAVVGVATIGPEQGVVWRGQANIAWALTSKIGRNADGTRTRVDVRGWERHENAMIDAARSTGADGAYRMTDVEILARLRHHGARTRLIDCTEDPVVALWFACSDEMDADTDDHDGLIVALDRADFAVLSQPWTKAYADLAAVPAGKSGHFVKIPPIDPRISAQRGVFVFSSSPPSTAACRYSEVEIRWSSTWDRGWKKRLDVVCGTSSLGARRERPVEVFPTVIGIVVPKIIKPLLRRTLASTYGLSRASMFPDFPGLGELYSRS